MHTCAHNPTGIDPSPENWHTLAGVFAEKNLVPVFDTAYQGYATGDQDADAYAVRHFISCGLRPIIAQSFAKNLGLYGARAVAPSGKRRSLHFARKCNRPKLHLT